MRIDDFNPSSGTQSTEQSGQAAQTRAAEKESLGKNRPDSNAVSGTDHAEVSQLAQSLTVAPATAPSSARLEQLRMEVQSGKYDVPAQAVASALIEAHLKD